MENNLKNMKDKDLFGNDVPTVYFKAVTTKNDDGWMMCDCGCSGVDNNDHYVVTTEHLKCDEVPDKCVDAKTFAELVAKLLNEYYNKQTIIGCVCENEIKHGTTSIDCCNHCGKPTEEFWIKK